MIVVVLTEGMYRFENQVSPAQHQTASTAHAQDAVRRTVTPQNGTRSAIPDNGYWHCLSSASATILLGPEAPSTVFLVVIRSA